MLFSLYVESMGAIISVSGMAGEAEDVDNGTRKSSEAIAEGEFILTTNVSTLSHFNAP